MVLVDHGRWALGPPSPRPTHRATVTVLPQVLQGNMNLMSAHVASVCFVLWMRHQLRFLGFLRERTNAEQGL